jgi:hypothetical protein
MDVDGDAAAVVDDAHSPVGEDRHVDRGGVAGQGLVDRVVDDLVHQVMEPAGPGGTDVHARSLANRFEALENLDRVGAVFRLLLGLRGFGCHVWIGLLTVILATLNPIKSSHARRPEAPI